MNPIDLSSGQQPHAGIAWLVDQINVLADLVRGGVSGLPTTETGSPFVVFVNGARRAEGAPSASTRDTSEWDVLRATLKAVQAYRDEIEGEAVLTWRTMPEFETLPDHSVGLYLRLAFEGVGAHPALRTVLTSSISQGIDARTYDGAGISVRTVAHPQIGPTDAPSVVQLKPPVIGEGIALPARQVIEQLIAEMDAGLEFDHLLIVATQTRRPGLDVRSTHGATETHWLCHKAAQSLLASPALDGEG